MDKAAKAKLLAAEKLREKYETVPEGTEGAIAVRINTRQEGGKPNLSSFLGLFRFYDAFALVGEIAVLLDGTVSRPTDYSLRVLWGGPRYLSTAEVAEICGLASSTVRMYRHRGDMPEADVMVGSIPGWLPETIEAYKLTLPGRGARTDLRS